MQFYIDGNQNDADEFFQHHLLDVSDVEKIHLHQFDFRQYKIA